MFTKSGTFGNYCVFEVFEDGLQGLWLPTG
ncbi:hypothetical protein GGR95_003847 [Sulfitobacter undariae]|uniref:Uncharacterized protein n=1 Tax=Sulfitobacter undariae TaxID=1563671 RepID=A0A7W6E8I4_9RHOB|nr:hypothetical protein [Sulfitobacter undariae]